MYAIYRSVEGLKIRLTFANLAAEGEKKRVSKFANAPDEDPKNGKY
jgi:hypothetical protein